MAAVSFANVLTARPTTLLADCERVLNAAKADAAGFAGVRSGASFESVFGTTTVASANYAGVDQLIDEARERGFTHLWFSIGPYVGTDASWSTLFGAAYHDAGWLVKKRPPSGAANVGWAKIVECLNALLSHIVTRWTGAGGSASNIYFQIYQEPGTGAADGPSTDDTVGGTNAKDAMVAAGHEGKWDDDALWDSMGGDYVNVRGFHEIMDYICANVTMPANVHWIVPAMENQTGTAATNETATMFAAGHTWWGSMITAKSKLEMDVHAYYGSITSLLRQNDPALYAELTNHHFQARKALLMSTWASVLAGATNIRWHSSEYAIKPLWLFGTDTDANFNHQIWGEFEGAAISAMRQWSNCDTVGWEEMMTDPTFGTESFGVINGAGNTSYAIQGVARGNGSDVDITIAAPTWGGTWRKGTNELAPSTLDTGLLYYYTGNEASGDRADSGPGNLDLDEVGGAIGSAAGQSGIMGNAIHMASSEVGDYLNKVAGNEYIFSGSRPVFWDGFFYIETLPTANNGQFIQQVTGPEFGSCSAFLAYNAPNTTLEVQVRNGDGNDATVTSSVVLAAGRWYYWYAHYDPTTGTLKVGIDGNAPEQTVVTPQAWPAGEGTEGISIAFQPGAANAGAYRVQHMGCWGRILTSLEIADRRAAVPAPITPPS